MQYTHLFVYERTFMCVQRASVRACMPAYLHKMHTCINAFIHSCMYACMKIICLIFYLVLNIISKRKTIDLYCYIKVLKVKPVYQQMTLSPKLGVVRISTLWHFRLPLPIQMFIKVASSPRLSGIGMPSPILWSHPLKMQRIVLLSSRLW